jgi:hypothetical protein
MRITGVEGLKGGGVRDGRYMNRNLMLKYRYYNTIDFNTLYNFLKKIHMTYIPSGVPL